jgi:hypothetical protein
MHLCSAYRLHSVAAFYRVLSLQLATAALRALAMPSTAANAQQAVWHEMRAAATRHR